MATAVEAKDAVVELKAAVLGLPDVLAAKVAAALSGLTIPADVQAALDQIFQDAKDSTASITTL